jgi:hypothetical protein
MVPHPLSPRVVALSWLSTLVAWPLVWAAMTASQGLGVVLQGGEWIGVSLAWGQHPWALVNQPHVGFAATRGALGGYWLAPMIAGLLLAILPALLLSSGRGWTWELLLLQISMAGALLVLGWAPGLGMVDGPAAGLARFWRLPWWSQPLVCALLGGVAIHLPTMRLCGFLWHAPAGPTRRRRMLSVLLHGMLPALLWVVAVAAAGWPLPGHAVAGLAVVALGSLLAAWVWLPRAPLRPRALPGWPGWLALAAVSLALAGVSAWAGSASRGQPRALVWGHPGITNNVRPAMVVTRLTQPPAPEAPPAR